MRYKLLVGVLFVVGCQSGGSAGKTQYTVCSSGDTCAAGTRCSPSNQYGSSSTGPWLCTLPCSRAPVAASPECPIDEDGDPGTCLGGSADFNQCYRSCAGGCPAGTVCGSGLLGGAGCIPRNVEDSGRFGNADGG